VDLELLLGNPTTCTLNPAPNIPYLVGGQKESGAQKEGSGEAQSGKESQGGAQEEGCPQKGHRQKVDATLRTLPANSVRRPLQSIQNQRCLLDTTIPIEI
jgi:hypothetical protein